MSDLQHDAQIARALVERLRSVFDLQRVVWFGSRAQGTGGPDRDWDLLALDLAFLPNQLRAGKSAACLERSTSPTLPTVPPTGIIASAQPNPGRPAPRLPRL